MKNQYSNGKTVDYVNTGSATISAGTPIIKYGKAGVTVNPISAGAHGVLDMQGGIYDFPLTTAGSSAADGATLYLNAGAVTIASASGAEVLGYSVGAIASGATVCRCYLK